MAATYTALIRSDFGSQYAELGTFTCDSSYPAGGYSLPATVGIYTVEGVIVAGSNTSGEGYLAQYNTQTSKLQIYWSAAATPAATPTVTVVGSATSTALPLVMFPATGNAGVLGVTAAQATQTIPASTFGISLGLGSTTAAKFAEVTNGTSLSGVTFNLLTFGY